MVPSPLSKVGLDTCDIIQFMRWSEQLTVELTDSARELAAMANWLLNLPKTEGDTYGHLSSNLGLSGASTNYLFLLYEARARLDRMAQFTREIEEKDFTDEHRSQVLHAASRLAEFFTPLHQSQSFDVVRSNFVKPEDALAFSLFSDVARRYRPLRRITPDSRDQAVAAIDKALKEVAEDADLPKWAGPILREGLERLKLVIVHLTFFGHDAAFEALLALDRQTHGLTEYLREKSPTVAQAIWSTGKVVALCVSLFNAPVTAHNAYVEYQGFVRRFISEHSLPLALPKPDDSSDEEVDGGVSTEV